MEKDERARLRVERYDSGGQDPLNRVSLETRDSKREETEPRTRAKGKESKQHQDMTRPENAS